MPKVKAAVLERSRRSTAGKRMQTLMGKAQEDDDAFWSHSIWSEGGGGFSGGRKRQRDGDDSSSSSDSGSDSDSLSDGEGSFRMSDEESEAAVDQFDSDFDESETEDEEEGGEGATERELLAEERRSKLAQKKKRQQVAFQGRGSGGRDLMKKKKGQMTKRGPTGEGWNAGLVLNWPAHAQSDNTSQVAIKPMTVAQPSVPTSSPAAVSSSLPIQQSQTKPQHMQVTQVTSSSAPISTKATSKPAAKSTIESHRHLRGNNASSKPKETSVVAKVTQKQRPAAAGKKNAQKPRITQEQLILEAIKSTEMENSKWLSARKRIKAEAAHRENAAMAKSTNNHNPISRFHSRRGCHNTLTFLDMEHLPDILTRNPRKAGVTDTSTIRSPRKRRADSATSQGNSSSPDIEKEQTKCVITGKIARYRDPKTMMGYYDIDAYKELRRRLDAGELPKKEKKRKVTTKQPTKQKPLSTGGDSTIIAKLPSTGIDVRVTIKVGNSTVPPPQIEKKRKDIAAASTPNKPRWDDASDNLYAKSFSSSKRRRSQIEPQNGISSQHDVAHSKSSVNFTAKMDASQSTETAKQNNGNHVEEKGAATLEPIASSIPPLPLSSTTAKIASAEIRKHTNGSSEKLENGIPSTTTAPKKSNSELTPTPAELNTFMQTWMCRPENRNNFMPSLQQKQQITKEIGVDKKRLEGWFYRFRKKMKQENPPQKNSKGVDNVVLTNAGLNPGGQVGITAEKEVLLCQKDELQNVTDSHHSNEQGHGASTNGTSTKAKDEDDKSDSQIPLRPSSVGNGFNSTAELQTT